MVERGKQIVMLSSWWSNEASGARGIIKYYHPPDPSVTLRDFRMTNKSKLEMHENPAEVLIVLLKTMI